MYICKNKTKPTKNNQQTKKKPATSKKTTSHHPLLKGKISRLKESEVMIPKTHGKNRACTEIIRNHNNVPDLRAQHFSIVQHV